jgi:Tuberculosis necrotizing toxin
MRGDQVPSRRQGPRANPLPPMASRASPGSPLAAFVQPEDSERVCRGLKPYPIALAYRQEYFCGDWRLGPKRLPHRGVVGSILRGYHRLGGLTAVEFLDRWWDPAADSGQGDWRYPPNDGYASNGQGVIAAPLVLHAGQTVDRFGNEAARFLAPAGTKYGKRALPPSSLNTSDPRYPYNYHLYRVTSTCTG